MASLKEQLDAAGYDVSNFDEAAVIKQLDDAGYDVSQFETPMRAPTLMDTVKYWLRPGMPQVSEGLAKDIKAGGAGIAELATGKGLQQAKETVEKVEAGEKPETTAGKVGSKVGEFFTPEQIALQAAMGPLAEMSGFGPWLGKVFTGWSEKAAQTAIGIVKTIAKKIGLANLDELGQFLLTPIKIGSKEFEPIITATGSTKDMLARAEAVRAAAGRALEKINPLVDEGISNSPTNINLPNILQGLDKLKLAVQDVAPKLGKHVVKQFDEAIDDFLSVVKEETLSPNPKMFTKLRQFKTAIGHLMDEHADAFTSKAALSDVYSVISNGIDEAANAVSPELQAAFHEANTVYNKILPVIESLEGKLLTPKSAFSDIPALGAGLFAGWVNPVAALPTAVGAHLARKYGPQAVARGLNVLAPKTPALVKSAAQSLPPVVKGITEALSPEQGQ